MMKQKIRVFLSGLIAISFLLSLGCETDTNVKQGSDTIEANTQATFVGQVLDFEYKPLQGVGVSLYADRIYSATTDSLGNYIINVPMGKIIATPGGGNGTVVGPNAVPAANANTTINRTFTVVFQRRGFAPYRDQISFSGSYGYSDGSGNVVLIEQLGQEQPVVVLHPYIDNFQFSVYAGGEPAKGARVTLHLPTGTYTGPSAHYEYATKSFKADENGLIQITADDELPANGSYKVFAAPYDPNGDGLYEFDAATTTFVLDATINTDSSLIHFEYNLAGKLVITQTQQAAIALSDSDDDINIVYCNLSELNSLPAEYSNFEIMVMLNRPVKYWDYALTDGSSRTMAIEVATTNNYFFTITPQSRLTPHGNNYTLKLIQTITYEGTPKGPFTLGTFKVYDENAYTQTLAAITPNINIEDKSSYKVDWDDLLYGGSPLSSDPYAKQGLIPSINISWPATEGADGYTCWVKDTLLNTTWNKVNLTVTYHDGVYCEGSFSVPNGFDYFPWTASPAIEPFINDNELKVAILPTNAEDNDDPALLEAASFVPLKLSDNWGPKIDTAGLFSGSITRTFNGARYDDTVQVAFSEPLADKDLIATDPNFADGVFGAAVTSGYFKVKEVRWFDDVAFVLDTDLTSRYNDLYGNYRFLMEVDLEPTVANKLSNKVTTGDRIVKVDDLSGFKVGENVAINGGVNLLIAGFDATGKNLFLDTALPAPVNSSDYDANSPLAMVGPVKVDTNKNITRVADELTRVYINAPTNAPSVGDFAYINDPDTLVEIIAVDTSLLGSNIYIIDFKDGTKTKTLSQLSQACLSGTVVKELAVNSGVGIGSAGLATGTTSAQAAADPNNSFETAAAIANLAVGDWVELASASGTNKRRVRINGLIPTVAPFVYTFAPTTSNLLIPAGWSITELGHDAATMTDATTCLAYPTVRLAAGTLGFDITSKVTFDDDAGPADPEEFDVLSVLYTTITSGSIRIIGLDDIPSVTDADNIIGTITRKADILKVKVMDRNGNTSQATDKNGDNLPDGDEITANGAVR